MIWEKEGPDSSRSGYILSATDAALVLADAGTNKIFRWFSWENFRGITDPSKAKLVIEEEINGPSAIISFDHRAEEMINMICSVNCKSY